MKINVKGYVDARKQELIQTIGDMSYSPRLLIIQIGDNSASNSYIKGKIQDAKEIGIRADLFKFNDSNSLFEFLAHNSIDAYDGIILQEPSGLTESERQKVLDAIGPTRDVDGFMINSCFKPCTPQGILHLIDEFYSINLKGTVVTIVGRGKLVGKPLANMLIERGATVISCNSTTPNLEVLFAESDIIISAAGKANLITADMLPQNKEKYIIDAGINFDEEGKICGDCDKELYKHEKIFVTPVPGGVGLMTRVELMTNTVAAALAKEWIELEKEL